MKKKYSKRSIGFFGVLLGQILGFFSDKSATMIILKSEICKIWS
jgi:hypothetical protein